MDPSELSISLERDIWSRWLETIQRPLPGRQLHYCMLHLQMFEPLKTLSHQVPGGDGDGLFPFRTNVTVVDID